jgi:predicted nucleic acid-binding protein
VRLVVDASISVVEPLKQARADLAPALARLRQDTWIVPALWWFEVRNALVVNERRGRLTTQALEMALGELSQAAVTIDRTPDETMIIDLARRHRLTVYDAAYLELAKRERLDLATLDASLAEAARREGVAVVGDPA